MSIWKRILALIVMALSVLLAIVCIVGIIGNWYLNRTMTDSVVRVLTGVEQALEVSEDTLGKLDTRLGNARERIDEFERNVERAGENFVENPVLLTALSERLDLGIAPAVLDVLETVQAVREKVVAVQNAVQALNALPFVSVDQNLEEGGRLQRLSDGAAALTQGVEDVRNGVREAKAEVVGKVMFRIGKGTARLDRGLETIQTAVQGYNTQVSDMLNEVTALKSSLPLWFDLASIGLTLVLLWIILSQVVTFVYGLSIYRNENLFARWIPAPEEEPAELPPEEPEDS
jgi:hypothetical protein